MSACFKDLTPIYTITFLNSDENLSRSSKSSGTQLWLTGQCYISWIHFAFMIKQNTDIDESLGILSQTQKKPKFLLQNLWNNLKLLAFIFSHYISLHYFGQFQVISEKMVVPSVFVEVYQQFCPRLYFAKGLFLNLVMHVHCYSFPPGLACW